MSLLSVRWMGRPTFYYPGDGHPHRMWHLVGMLLMGSGGIIMAWAAFKMVVRWLNFGLAAVWGSALALLVFGGSVLLVGMVIFGVGFTRSVKNYLLYEFGMAYQQGTRVQTYRWEDFTSLVIDPVKPGLTATRGSRLVIRLRLKSGTRLYIGPAVQEMDQLCEEIRSRLNPIWNSAAETALQRGEMVNFGPLAVNRLQGITWRGRSIHWEDLEKIVIGDGRLVIHSKNRQTPQFASLPTRKIPNLDVFAWLVKLYLTVNGWPAGDQPLA